MRKILAKLVVTQYGVPHIHFRSLNNPPFDQVSIQRLLIVLKLNRSLVLSIVLYILLAVILVGNKKVLDIALIYLENWFLA